MSDTETNNNNKSTSGNKVKKRKVLLYNQEVPHDFGRKYRQELIDSYDHAKEEHFFMIFGKILFILAVVVAIGAVINYYF